MNKKLYKEVCAKSKTPLTAEQQEDPYIMLKIISTETIEATSEEIERAKDYFEENKECKFHLIYDEESFMYDFRYCGICGKFIAMF